MSRKFNITLNGKSYVVEVSEIKEDDATVEETPVIKTPDIEEIEDTTVEDKIVVENKPETHGKIGKLKSILPFKKLKPQDNSLMGDLFGWAGIAANDEDFSIPGFFTPSASRKQGS